MDSLNNLLGRIGSALWFGWGNKQAPQQTTSLWQGSVNNQLYPQMIADLPQANIQRTPNDLSPRAFDAQWLMDTIGQKIQSGPTIDYDFLSSLPNIQTPQWTFVQKTWQVVDNQWQIIGQPNQITPQTQQTSVVWQQFTSQLPVVEQLPQAQVWAGSTLPEVITPTTFKLDESTIIKPTKIETPDGQPILASNVPLSSLQSSDTETKDNIETTVKTPEPIENKEWSWLSRTLNLAKGVWRELLWVAYGWLTTDADFDVYQSLDDTTKLALNPQLWSNASMIGRDDTFVWLQKVAKVLNDTNISEIEKVNFLSKEYPNLPKSEALKIAWDVLVAEESKAKKVAEISGIQYQNTREQKKYEQEQAKVFTDLIAPEINILTRGTYSKWIEVWLDPITASDNANRANSEAKRSINLISESFASVNAWLAKRTDLQWSVVKALDWKLFQEVASNQLQVYKRLVEYWVSWVDSSTFLWDRLREKWLEWPDALRQFLNAPLVKYVESLPDSSEKSTILLWVKSAASIDDAIKAIEIWANYWNSESYIKTVNSVFQWWTLWATSLVKNIVAWWTLWDTTYASQTMNAEMNVTNIDFSEDWVALASKYAYDFGRLAPEVWVSIGMVLAWNAMWAQAAALTTRWINSASRVATLLPTIKIWSNVPKYIATPLKHINNLTQWTIRTLPKIANVLTEESLTASSLQAFMPWTNTAEEFDNYLLWLGVWSVFELTPSLWRLARNRNANQFGISRLDDDMARMLIKGIKENKAISQAEESARQAYVQSIVKDQWVWYWEALIQAEVDDTRRLTPEQKKTIKDKAWKETILLEDVKAAKDFHNNALERLDALYVNNPELAEKISRTAYQHSKIVDIYKNSIDVADEAERYAALIRSTELSKMNGTNKWLLDQIRSDLDTVLPIRVWSQVDNKFNVSLDAFNVRQSWLVWYSLPNELKESLWDINFYKPLDDQKVEFLSEIGITKENVDTYFTKTDDWYLINKQWIEKIGIIDKNNSILQSQVNLIWDNKTILDMVESKLGTEAWTLVQKTNAIDNIYNSIKNIC